MSYFDTNISAHQPPEQNQSIESSMWRCLQITVVMKFGGSSVANAARMREVAAIICSFPDQLPCVVLSAMGKVICRKISINRSQLGNGNQSSTDSL